MEALIRMFHIIDYNTNELGFQRVSEGTAVRQACGEIQETFRPRQALNEKAYMLPTSGKRTTNIESMSMMCSGSSNRYASPWEASN